MSIHCEDCLKGMRKMPGLSVDLVVTDPPFNIGYHYDTYDDNKSYKEYIKWCEAWGEQVSRVLKPTGSFWLAIGDEYAAELKVLFTRHLGFTCRSWIVWYYTFGVNCKRNFSRSHTHLFYFVLDPPKAIFNEHEIRVPSARQLVYKDRRANAKGRLPDNTWILRPQESGAFAPDENTWHHPRVCGTFNERAGFIGCQMPEQLLARIIRVSSNEGDMVLDPFAGSGSTLLVAKKLGRRFQGFDISENYVDHIERRLATVAVGDPLEGKEVGD